MVIEALACEVPVIVTDVGDSAIFASEGQSGWVIPSKDGQALIAALHEAAALDAEQRRAMGRHGRQLLFELGMDMGSVLQFHQTLYLEL